jgi:hypothetical protein
VKKRGAKRLHWDVSYKEAKHLARYHGHNVYKGLVTAVNEVGEIRLQFHVGTDGQDQMTPAIKQLLLTMKAYGQDAPELFFTDNPQGDKHFFTETIPSLKSTQLAFDSQTVSSHHEEKKSALTNYPTVANKLYDLVEGRDIINTKVNALRTMMLALPIDDRVLSLDCEWDVNKNDRGIIIGSGRVALIQLAWWVNEHPDVLLLRVQGLRSLPKAVIELFKDTTFTFIGRCIGADLKKIGRDFELTSEMKDIESVDIGVMARCRGKVKSGCVSLQHLSECILGLELPKEQHVRMSKWSASKLNDEQISYAALDVIVAMDIYYKLLPLVDLCARLLPSEAKLGLDVDIVPSHGNVQILATRGAIGKIVDDTHWTSQFVEIASAKRKKDWKVVQVSKVEAPNLIIPGLKKVHDEQVSLGKFGPTPFLIRVPITMLKNHVEDTTPLVVDTSQQDSVEAVESIKDVEMRLSHNDDDDDDDNDDDDDDDDDNPGGDGDNNGGDYGAHRDHTQDDSVDDVEEITKDEVQTLKEVETMVMFAQKNKSCAFPHTGDNPLDFNELLGRPPAVIEDKFSSVLCDPFHEIH